MQKVQHLFNITALLSGLSHVFCCGIPLFFSFISLLVGLGVLSTLPAGFTELHDTMHDWEMPILIFSGVMLFFGWTLHVISERIDCHNTGCHHKPCAPKKKRSSRILIVASVLFAVNIAAYGLFHYEHEADPYAEAAVHITSTSEGAHDHHAH